MAAYFFDSSALIKRYVLEPGTPWVRALLDPASRHQIFLVRLSMVEVAATLARQARTGNIPGASAALAITQVRHAFAHEFRNCRVKDDPLKAVFTHEGIDETRSELVRPVRGDRGGGLPGDSKSTAQRSFTAPRRVAAVLG